MKVKGLCQTEAQVFPFPLPTNSFGGNIPTKTSCPEGGGGGKFCFYLFPFFYYRPLPHIYASTWMITS